MKTLKVLLKKIRVKDYQHFINYARYSNTLYNKCLEVVNEYYNETGKYIGRFNIEKEVKSYDCYKLLPAQTAQQIIKSVDQNYRSYLVLVVKKSKGQYSDVINIPKFRKENSLGNIYFTFQNSRVVDNKIEVAVSNGYNKEFKVKPIVIPFNKQIDGRMKFITLQPRNNGKYFIMYITYEETPNKQEKTNKSIKIQTNKLSIDFGINNLITCYSTVSRPFIINGRPLKSFNGYYNKLKSKAVSELKIKNNKRYSNKLDRIDLYRKNYIDDYFHKVSKSIQTYCELNNIGEVIIGYNKEWKQEVNMSKVNNQNFSYIPFYQLKNKLKYKLEDIGCKFIIVEESYTSKCSSLDFEQLGKHDKYLGYRIKRGLYKSKVSGRFINADVNGAINIMRKYVTDDVVKQKLNNQSVKGLVFNPIKIIF